MIVSEDDLERFWSLVDTSGSCWLWTAWSDHGYGHFKFQGRGYRAHRWIYEVTYGPLKPWPEQSVDHVRDRGCTSTLCVRPEHLEAVSQFENTMRSRNFIASQVLRTHCPKGHSLDDEENQYISPVGSRGCRECRREATRSWRRRKRETERSDTPQHVLQSSHSYPREGT